MSCSDDSDDSECEEEFDEFRQNAVLRGEGLFQRIRQILIKRSNDGGSPGIATAIWALLPYCDSKGGV